MLAKIISGATVGLNIVLMTVEVDFALEELTSFTKVRTQSRNLDFNFLCIR